VWGGVPGGVHRRIGSGRPRCDPTAISARELHQSVPAHAEFAVHHFARHLGGVSSAGVRRGFVCVVAVIVLGAAGCGSSDDTGSAPPATTTTTSVAAATNALDVHHLPVGDNQTSDAPARGKIWLCRAQQGGGGAMTQGPWFNDDGTWDATKKVAVDGNVMWDAASSDFSDNGTDRVITANALPQYGTGEFPVGADTEAYQYDRNPNSIKEQQLSLTLPARPTDATESCIGGEVGIGIDGVPIFTGFDAGGRDAVAWEVQDKCHGHPQISGLYHHHDLSPCVADDGTGHSALAGYAFDGYGIFGYRGEDGTEVTNDDLDGCHGHTHTIEWDGEQVEMYHYHATREFPYTVGCFHGTSTVNQPIGG
jgi:hypothetical protein